MEMLTRRSQWHERGGSQIIHAGQRAGGEKVETETVGSESGCERRVF